MMEADQLGSSEHSAEPAGIMAELEFAGPVSGVPTNYFDVEPPSGVPPRFATERRSVLIRNARLSSPGFELAGFTISALAGPQLPNLEAETIERHYYPRVVQLVRSLTGARSVIVFDHTLRSSAIKSRMGGGPDAVVAQAHNDYTLRSAPQRVREVLERSFAGDVASALSGRYAIINVWRPTNATVEQWPLALCDKRSIDEDCIVDAELRWPHRTGHVTVMRHGARQQWYYFPRMRTSEAIVFACYDARAVEGHPFGAHAAFFDPTGPASGPARESIEVRTVALF
jgi:hypothetical protein